MSRFASLAVLSTLSLTLTLPSLAQVPDPVLAAQAPVPGAGHHYIGTGAETVNPADGSLTFNLPFDPPAGRQISLKFGVRFSGTEQFYLTNQGYSGNITWFPNWEYGQAPWQVGAWSYDLPIVTAQASLYWTAVTPDCPNGVCTYHYSRCWGNDSYVFRGLDGTQYSLPIGNVLPAYGNYLPTFCPASPNNYKGPGNNHGLLSILDPTTWAVTVVDQSGTTYHFPGAGGSEPQAPNYSPSRGGSLATSITDRNGNQLVLSGNSYQDSTGRTALSWTGIGNNGDTINVAGLGGPITLKWITTPISFPELGHNVGSSSPCTIYPSNTTSISLVSEIDLPNGQKYTFQPDTTNHGKIGKVTFPDGGYVRYIWGENTSAQLAHMTWTDPSNNPASCDFIYDIPAITDRYVSFDGSTEVLHQHFAYQTSWSGVTWTSKTTTVTTTDLLTGQSTVTQYGYGAVSGDNNVYVTQSPLLNLIPVENSVAYEDGSQKTYKVVNKSWLNSHVMTSDQTILYDNMGNPSIGSASVRCYDPNEQVTNSSEYGFQTEGSYPGNSCGGVVTSYAGPLRRQTKTVYHPFFSWNGSTTPPTYSGTHIVNAPDSVIVADGSNNTAKQTLYGYDQKPLGTSGAINLSSVSGARANITTLQRLISGSAYATTTYIYWDTGQLHQMIDACGNTTCSDMTTGANHTTIYSYADSYASGTGTPPGQTHAYLTQVTLPNTGKTHVEKFTWGYSDGAIRSHTDQNGRISTFQYNDPGLLGRLTEIDSPDGGKATVTYNDSTYSSTNNTPNFTVTKSITSTLNLLTTTAFDGLGHKVRTLTSDPQGAISSDTAYNGLAQVWKEYNPYRSGDSLYFKQNTYDPLGRVISTVMQDGSNSTVTTSYAVPCSTVTDEAGNQRHSCSDSLGRLTEVDEPGNGAHNKTPGTATITIGGSEQSHGATAGSGSITVGDGGESCETIQTQSGPVYVPQTGAIYATINGAAANNAGWGGSCNGTTETLQPSVTALATQLATNINQTSAGVTATASGSSIGLKANTTGASTDYSVLITETWNLNTSQYGQGYTACCSGSLTGGMDATSDSGTVAITVNGFQASASYGSGSTPSSIAANLASLLNSGSPVTASVSGSTITLTATDPGSASNYSLSSSVTWNTQVFSQASFTVAAPTALSGGTDATLGTPLVTLYSYDVLNNLTCAVQKATDTTAFTSCAAAPAVWRPRSFVYDSLSRLTAPTNPESGTISYTYDANGNVASKTQPEMNKIPADTSSPQTNTVNYSYDTLNRLTQKTYSDNGSTVQYGYDGTVLSGCTYAVPTLSDTNPKGRRTSMCDASGATQWTAAIVGNVGWKATEARNINGITKNIVTQSNLAGKIAQLTYPSGRVVNYAPGSSARYLSALDTDGTQYAANATYAAFGGLTGMTNGASPITVSNTYNERLQPVTLSAAAGVNTLISRSYDFHRAIGDNGNIFQIVNNIDNQRSQSFTYDPLNRIATAQSQATSGAKCWGQTFAVDAWGNLTTVTPSKCAAQTLSAPATSQNQVFGYCYDKGGNLLGTSGCPGLPYAPTYNYDAENRLSTFSGVTYIYDGDGNRVEKSNGTLYWGPGPLAESDLSGTMQREYIYFSGKRIARRDASNGSVHYIYADHLGSSSVIANSTGTLPPEEDLDYFPYGGVAYGTSSDHYMFNGKERDAESNLDNFGARYDASSMGRFMTPDPLMASAHASNPQTWNRYAYALNNPVRYVDPDGMEVPATCAQDKKCQITVNVNVIWDKQANNGKGLTDQQKKDFKNGQIAAAVEDYAKSNIKLNVTYTEGSFTVDANNHPTITGDKKDAVNVVASDKTYDGSNESYNTRAGSSYILLGVNTVHDYAVYPFVTNTTEHELAHHFLGDTVSPPTSSLQYFYREGRADTHVEGQSMNFSQSAFREGLEPRSYAAPTNPEANKPQQ